MSVLGIEDISELIEYEKITPVSNAGVLFLPCIRTYVCFKMRTYTRAGA